MWEKLRRTGRPERDGDESEERDAAVIEASERLIDVGVSAGDDATVRQETYEAWAERLKTHKQAKLADLDEADLGTAEAESGTPDEEADPVDNWSPEGLQHGDPDLALLQPNEMTNQELLASLGLSIAATDKEIQRTFRRLVMEHHPDRWQDADSSTRQEHEERLLHVTALYNELRSRGR